MGTLVVERGVTAPSAPGPRRTRWPSHWPLSVIFLGVPLWWVLGLMTAVPMLVSVVMARDLLRRRDRLVLPAGSLWWALFLAWVALGVFVLWVDAPGAVPGGGLSRLMVFGLRAAWYVAATVVLLWTMSRTEEELSTQRVVDLVASLFVVTTLGGLLGLLAPTLEFRSFVELFLPAGLRSNGLVSSLVHPATAEVQSVLGRPSPRPQAPFAFANTWGSVMALTLPFFLVACLRKDKPWRRFAAPVVLVVAAVPIIYSLNRGLWVCLALGGVGLVLMQLAKRRFVRFVTTVAVLLVLGAAFAVSPLGTVYSERIAHQHSNDRRSELLDLTVSSAASGSPVVGFGSTRDVEGNFTSIGGGATADCDACGVPALGTQGHVWLVIFSQGLVGLVWFLLFFVRSFVSSVRCRTSTETIATFVLAFFGIQLFVYDTLDLPFVVVMLAVALVAREHVALGRVPATRRRAVDGWDRVRRAGPFLAVTVLAGVVAGTGWAVATPSTYKASVSVMLGDVPMELDTATTDPAVQRSQKTRPVTVDTEAGLLVSHRTLRSVAGNGADADALARRLSVRVPPLSRVLVISARADSPEQATRTVDDVARAYLAERRVDLVARRRAALEQTERQVDVLLRGASYYGRNPSAVVAATDGTLDRLAALQQEISALTVTPVDIGEVIGSTPAKVVPPQREVPIVSGGAIGLAVGALVLACRPRWRPRPARLRFWRRARGSRTS